MVKLRFRTLIITVFFSITVLSAQERINLGDNVDYVEYILQLQINRQYNTRGNTTQMYMDKEYNNGVIEAIVIQRYNELYTPLLKRANSIERHTFRNGKLYKTETIFPSLSLAEVKKYYNWHLSKSNKLNDYYFTPDYKEVIHIFLSEKSIPVCRHIETIGYLTHPISYYQEKISSKKAYEEEEKRKLKEYERNQKDEKKKQEELAFERKVKTPSEIFPASKLSNKKSIDIDFSEEAIKVLHHFMVGIAKRHPKAYERDLKSYNENLKLARARGHKPEDYSLHDLNIYITKLGSLTDITIDDTYIYDPKLDKSVMNEIPIGRLYLDSLKNLVKITNKPIISLKGIDYAVNAKFNFYYTPLQDEKEYSILFSKNKNGKIFLYDVDGLDRTRLRSFLNTDNKTKDLEKGKYSAKIQRIYPKARITHFQNYGEKKSVSVKMNSYRDEIKRVKKIETF